MFEVVYWSTQTFIVKAFKIILFISLKRGREPGNDTENPFVEKNNLDLAFGFGSFSVYVIAIS